MDDQHSPGPSGSSTPKRDLTPAEQALEVVEAQERQATRDAIYNRARFEGLQIDPEVEFYPEVAGREPGDTNVVRWGFDLHPTVTFVSAGILVVFVAFTLLFPSQAEAAFDTTLAFINDGFGWFYILAANLFVLAAAFFAFSRYGKIRIGGPTAQPEFSRVAWYAMLISAGMGIGLMFWSIAEPIFHLNGPPPLFGVEPGSAEAGKAALATTFYHWGPHPWAIYGLVALALAFFAYNRGLPLTFRSVFYPLLRERIYGRWGDAIDVLTVLATLAGLATSLGFGVGQAAAGLNFLFGWPTGIGFQVLLIAVISAIAIVSVMAGLDGGVKRLSQFNIGLAALFMLFILVVGWLHRHRVRGEHRLLPGRVARAGLLERGLLRDRLAGQLDGLLLGLVDLLVTVRGDVHRPGLQGTHGPGDRPRCRAVPLAAVLPVDVGLRWHRAAPAAQRHP